MFVKKTGFDQTPSTCRSPKDSTAAAVAALSRMFAWGRGFRTSTKKPAVDLAGGLTEKRTAGEALSAETSDTSEPVFGINFRVRPEVNFKVILPLIPV